MAIATTTAERVSETISSCRRFLVALALFSLLPPAFLLAFVVLVDPHYVFGSPGWRGLNEVRPRYELHVVTAKPYQVRRIQPDAVALGSSRVEVGIDPRHPGWSGARVFNFAMPSSTSYETMLAFTHAQAVGRPLKQAVLGLDFFGFNIFFARNADQREARFTGEGVEGFASFLTGELKKRRPEAVGSGTQKGRTVSSTWNEALYLAVNADVAAAVARRDFKSGREHYELAGRVERREGGFVPGDWDEAGYLQAQPDVGYFAGLGNFLSGYHHYLAAGRAEGRLGGFQPADWDEERYLAANPVARIRIALGEFRTGYLHYVVVGRRNGALGGFPAAGIMDRLWPRRPALSNALFQSREFLLALFSVTAVSDAVSTVSRQSEPAAFDDKGMRVWHGHDALLRSLGGTGALIWTRLPGGAWGPEVMPPKLMYCFSNADTGLTMLDPYQFMLRRAYVEGTDLRLFITPVHAVMRELYRALGLSDRYEFWMKELVRINEAEAARAGRSPLSLWDFSDANAITREAIPVPGDATPMRWFWEHSHYRKATGTLILDRIFDYTDASRAPPADFGVRLTGSNIDAHVVRSRTGLASWAANDELALNVAAAARTLKEASRQAQATCW